jgi:hypothetical protein
MDMVMLLIGYGCGFVRIAAGKRHGVEGISEAEDAGVSSPFERGNDNNI